MNAVCEIRHLWRYNAGFTEEVAMRVLILGLLVLMLALAGCGQKGPLYRDNGEDATGNARAPTLTTPSRHLC